MKRFSVITLSLSIILAFLLMGCTSRETGVIDFVSPANGEVVRIEFTGVPNTMTTPLVVSSSYITDKMVHFYLNNIGPIDCLVKARAVNQQCSGLPLNTPGEYALTAVVDRLDGTADSYGVNFVWQPYTKLDKTFSFFGAKSWLGYLVVYLLLLLCVGILTFKMTKDVAKMFLALMVYTIIMIPISMLLPSGGVAFSMSCYLVPLAVIFGSTAMNMFRNPRPPLVIIRPDGTGVSYRTKKYSANQVVISEKDLNRGLMVSSQEKKE